MTRLDWEKARRTRRADHPQTFPATRSWVKRNMKYEARCRKCGGPILAGPMYVRQVDGRWEFMHLGHSTT